MTKIDEKISFIEGLVTESETPRHSTWPACIGVRIKVDMFLIEFIHRYHVLDHY
jgi:hypothetical protein